VSASCHGGRGAACSRSGAAFARNGFRRGLELTQIEADTCIRARYLRALEDERFELLPGTAYVRGFLRTYARYLGLDEQTSS
jgi:cytoskeleton protein RodZ